MERRIATLILVPPFTLFSKELAMGHRGYCRADSWLPDGPAGNTTSWSWPVYRVAMALLLLGQHGGAIKG